jgi:hypothetical protein
MKLRMLTEDADFEDLWASHPLGTELPFPIFTSFSDFMLSNIDQVSIDRPEPITDHEIKIGGAKTNGARNTVTVTMPRSAINNGGYSKWISNDDLWDLLTKSVESGYANPDPKGTTGQSSSIFQNIANITNTAVTFIMCTWLPDFRYLDQLKAAGKTKYNS